MSQQPVIETERLILRGMLPEDADAFFEMDSNPEVHKYLGNKPVTNKQHIRDVIGMIHKQYDENGIARWTVLEKASGQYIGWCGLKFFTESANGHNNFYEVGYRLDPRYWGKGYATEAARAALRYGFEIMRLNTIYAITDAGNHASRNVLTKAGLTYIEDFIYEGGLFEGTHCTWFKITQDEWSSKHQ
jgi:[ribosomal protein S5]-alanine N-acetyltransferase